MANRAHVSPVKIRVHSTELATDVIRGVGYRARCACGYRGPLRERHNEARVDAREHNLSERGT